MRTSLADLTCCFARKIFFDSAEDDTFCSLAISANAVSDILTNPTAIGARTLLFARRRPSALLSSSFIWGRTELNAR